MERSRKRISENFSQVSWSGYFFISRDRAWGGRARSGRGRGGAGVEGTGGVRSGWQELGGDVEGKGRWEGRG
jgi:hypothetical protein